MIKMETDFSITLRFSRNDKMKGKPVSPLRFASVEMKRRHG